jgi:hypothetical protein
LRAAIGLGDTSQSITNFGLLNTIQMPTTSRNDGPAPSGNTSQPFLSRYSRQKMHIIFI